MPNFNSTIEDLVAGDDWDFVRLLNSLPVGQSIAEAWLVIREDFWRDAAIIEKHITATISADGLIEDDGSGDETGKIRFSISHDETIMLSPYFKYFYGIKIKTDAEMEYTLEEGTISARAQVTTDA